VSPFGGVQAGYNWQNANFVYGVEADFSGSGRFNRNRSVFLSEGPIDVLASGGSSPEWFGTVRGRAGILVSPAMLAYVTGGYAYGRFEDRFTFNVTRAPGSGPTVLTTTTRHNDSGWVAGAGLEYKLDSRWSVKAEYQYLALQDNDALTTVYRFNAGQTGHFSSGLDINGIHTVQIGLNYALMPR
jgi:outer membrane immunogenic protein